MRRAARGVLRVEAGSEHPLARPVTLPTVACPSGQRSTPRKRVWLTATVGSNPTATARDPLLHKGFRACLRTRHGRAAPHLAISEPAMGMETAKSGAPI